MKVELNRVKKKDLPVIKGIYDYYIFNSNATFYTESVSVDELNDIFLKDHPKYKSFMILADGEINGFCYFSQFNKRQAYNRTAEITIYLKPKYTGKGIGQPTIEKLENIARQSGISVLIGVISEDNQPSIKLFEKCGYNKCAHYKKVGEKFNKVIDVVAYQKILF